jgi:hypothetical protein
MKVVVPEGIDSEAAIGGTPHQTVVLRLVFGDDYSLAIAACRAHPRYDLGDDVRVRLVVDLLRRVEAKSVKVKFGDPILRVPDDEVANGSGVLAIEVEGIPPLRRPLAGVSIRILNEIVPDAPR